MFPFRLTKDLSCYEGEPIKAATETIPKAPFTFPWIPWGLCCPSVFFVSRSLPSHPISCWGCWGEQQSKAKVRGGDGFAAEAYCPGESGEGWLKSIERYCRGCGPPDNHTVLTMSLTIWECSRSYEKTMPFLGLHSLVIFQVSQSGKLCSRAAVLSSCTVFSLVLSPASCWSRFLILHLETEA